MPIRGFYNCYVLVNSRSRFRWNWQSDCVGYEVKETYFVLVEQRIGEKTAGFFSKTCVEVH